MSAASAQQAQQLLGRYLESREPDDLFGAFGAAKGALAAAAPQTGAYTECVRTLADVMFAYFDLTGGFSVIDCAVEMRRREAAFAGDSLPQAWALRHPDWEGGTFSRALSDPAWTLHHPDGRRSQIWKDWTSWNGEDWPMGWQVRRPDGVMIELDEDQWGDSWQFDPAGPPPDAGAPPALPPIEALLARAAGLRERFIETSNLGDLEESLRVVRAAVERARETGSLRAAAFHTAATTGHAWFMTTGDVDVLREALEYARLALDESDPASDFNRCTALNMLAAIHQALCVATEDQAELAEAIEVGRQATAAARDADDWSVSATNLAVALRGWYLFTRERAALEEALDLTRRVVEGTPVGHPRRPGRLNTYGNVLSLSFDEGGDGAMLDQAISAYREALRLASPDEVDYPSILSSLSDALNVSARLGHDQNVLREAVELRREAVARTPPEGVARLARLNSLADLLEEWRDASGDRSVDDELRRTIREIELLDPDEARSSRSNETPGPPEPESGRGIPRELAYSFAAGTKWKKAFLAIDDDSPTLLAGMAEWVGATGFEKASDFAYYMVTAHGLHVGQQIGRGGLFGGGSYVDHFLPRDQIIGLDTDFIGTIQFDARDGSRVLVHVVDGLGQLGKYGMVHVPVVPQMQALANALGWRYDRQPAPGRD